MNSFVLDETKCTGCRTCYKACWLDVIRWDEEKSRPTFPYAQECVECNFCEISCPVGCLTVKIDYEKQFSSPYISGQK